MQNMPVVVESHDYSVSKSFAAARKAFGVFAAVIACFPDNRLELLCTAGLLMGQR